MAVAFLGAAFLPEAALAVALPSLTPEALARAAARRFSRAALFLCMMCFLAALSIWLWAALKAEADGLPAKTLRALLRLRRLRVLRTAALRATRTRFLADFIIGIDSD